MPAHKMTESERRALSLRLGNIVLYGTFGLLMFGPLAFGAVEPWSIFCLETGSVVLTFVWLAKQWIDDELQVRWNPLFLPIIAFAIWFSCRSFSGTAHTRTTHAQERSCTALMPCSAFCRGSP